MVNSEMKMSMVGTSGLVCEQTQWQSGDRMQVLKIVRCQPLYGGTDTLLCTHLKEPSNLEGVFAHPCSQSHNSRLLNEGTTRISVDSSVDEQSWRVHICLSTTEHLSECLSSVQCVLSSCPSRKLFWGLRNTSFPSGLWLITDYVESKRRPASKRWEPVNWEGIRRERATRVWSSSKTPLSWRQ